MEFQLDPELAAALGDSAPVDNDIFADIDWPEDSQALGFDHNQCLDCLLAGSTCVACSIVGPPSTILDASEPFNQEIGSQVSTVSPPTSRTSGRTPTSNGTAESVQGSARFSKDIKSILRVWYNDHRENPYPSNEEKDELAARTGLKRGQVSLWLANTRRRHRARRLAAAEQMAPPAQEPFENLNPFDRWKILPVDQEATPVSLIRAAYLTSNPPPAALQEPTLAAEYATSQFAPEQSTTTAYDTFFGQSMASFETGLTSMVNGSSISDSTFLSHNPSTTSRAQDSARRRRKHHAPKSTSTKSSGKARPFQCTFCPDATFATKYDWVRHEKSQHLSLEKWTCCLGGGVLYTDKFEAKCAFCAHPDPDSAHLETHHYSACSGKDADERSFYRKDHFFQHLRLTHEAKFVTHMEVWKTEQSVVKSRCGFCNASFTSWASRADHLASHFKCHASMNDWIGDLGLEPHILAKVEKCTRVHAQSKKPAQIEFAIPQLPRSFYDLNDKTKTIQMLPIDSLTNQKMADEWSLMGTSGNVKSFDDLETSETLDWTF